MKLRTLSILVLLLAARMETYAQVEARVPTSGTDVPEFYMDALGFAAADSLHARIDVYLHIPYDVLRFVSSNGAYKATYDATVNIMTDDNTSVAEKTWTEEITHLRYEETENRSAYNLSQRSLEVPPGSYTVRVQVRDNESKKTATVSRKIDVEPFNKPLSMSDIMLISKVSSDKGRLTIVPNISGNVADVVNGLYVFYEVYTKSPGDSIESDYTIEDTKRQTIFQQRVLHQLASSRTQVIEKLDTAQYSAGTYVLTVQVKTLPHQGSGEELSAEKKKRFVAKWGNTPYSVTDWDLAIRQLRYIAKDSEYKQLEEAKTVEEKKKLFEDFWRRRDPSPDTKRNEYMEEYYARVEYANEHFSHYLPGWRTDMGMVFILLGSPNNVERHPFDIDSKPYEIWSYYDYNRQVIFLDETGFGDYKLLTPIYDLLQRARP